MLSGEATNTNFIVFGFTQPGLELTIYRDRGEHANHYVTDAFEHAMKERKVSRQHVVIKKDRKLNIESQIRVLTRTEVDKHKHFKMSKTELFGKQGNSIAPEE